MIYADNAATTRISDLAFDKMLVFLRDKYGNPSSQYSFGIAAKKAIEEARQCTAGAIGAEEHEIFFTSGGSEGNNWVLQKLPTLFNGQKIHIITSAIEHHSVLNACLALEESGVEVSYLPVDENAHVSPDDIKKAIRPHTKLVSIMMANNEVGTIEPISEIADILKDKNILFHTDAVQAVGHIPIKVKELNIDILTASAHKFNGAKGIGFIYIRENINFPNFIFGGGQEHGMRAGTENTAAIVALACALKENIELMHDESKRQSALVKSTICGLRDDIGEIKINAENVSKLPGILNITFPDVSGEAMMHMLDLKGICVSTSSACNAGRGEPSHVLLAMGLSPKQAESSIRISYGRYNTIDDVKEIVRAIKTAYKKITQNLSD
jgi:cysteine desulfurase